MGPKAFQFFKEYLAISNSTALDQPLRKFDFVAVPGKAGAMEVRCAGLVSSRRFQCTACCGLLTGAC